MKNSKIDGLLILTRNNIYKKLIFFCICLLLGCCSLYGVDNVSDSAALMTVYLTFWTYCVRGRRMSYVKGCLFDWFRNGQREGYLWEFFLFVQVILFKRKNWSFIIKKKPPWNLSRIIKCSWLTLKFKRFILFVIDNYYL